MSERNPDLAEAAVMTSDILGLAEMGWRLVPCEPRTKRGLLPWHLALSDPAAVKLWLRLRPETGWGVVLGPSGLLCLDIENSHGHEELADLQAEHGRLPAGPRVVTGSMSGEHRYFRLPTDRQARAKLQLGAKVEVRTGHLLMMLPPSIHKDTGWIYRWVPGYEPWSGDVPAAPEWLLKMLEQEVVEPGPRRPVVMEDCYVRRAIESELTQLGRAVEGGRNHALNRSAYALFRFVEAGKASGEEVRRGLLEEARHLGLPEGEALATIRSAARARGDRGIFEGVLPDYERWRR